MKRLDKLGLVFRQVESITPRTRAEGDAGPAMYEVAISTEAPVDRWFGVEVLSHARNAIDMAYLKKGAAVLIDHGGDQVGVVEDAWVDEDKKLRGTIRFSASQRGQEVEADVRDGIRQNISVGYRILKAKLVKEGGDGTPDEWLVTRWQPHEVSLVSVPADLNAGVGRHLTRGEELPVEIEDDGPAVEEVRTMKTKEQLEAEAAAAAERSRIIEEANAEAKRANDLHIAQVSAICVENGMQHRIAEFLTSGKDMATITREILASIRTKGGASELPPEKDARQYSYAKAIRQWLGQLEGNDRIDGIEAEWHQNLRKEAPDGIKYRGGLLVPHRLTAERAYPLDTGTATEGQELVFKGPGEFIEYLRARLCVVALGARFIPGLVGNVGLARQTGAATASWVAEGAAVSDSMAAFDLVTLTPKTVMSTTGWTRQLLAQSAYPVEQLIREDLAAIMARAIDHEAIQGPGSSNKPKGVWAQTNILSYDVGPGANADAAPDYTDLVSMIGKVADADADQGALAFLTTPLLAATLKRSLVASAAGSDMIWTGDFMNGQVAGYRALASNQVDKTFNNGAISGGSEHGLLFGNWNEVLVGLWGALELVLDPYSSKKSGIIELTAFQLADVVVRHDKSFCKGINAIP